MKDKSSSALKLQTLLTHWDGVFPTYLKIIMTSNRDVSWFDPAIAPRPKRVEFCVRLENCSPDTDLAQKIVKKYVKSKVVAAEKCDLVERANAQNLSPAQLISMCASLAARGQAPLNPRTKKRRLGPS